MPDLHWLTDPEVFAVNRLDAHSDHVCYASPEEMRRGETSLRQSLNGIWKCMFSPNPAQRPADFWKEDFDCSGFGDLQVPGHAELQGLGQIQYINTLYPWDGHAELRPPEIDWDNNPVLSYCTDFTLNPGLAGKRVCISLQGVERAFYLWLNGHFLGYAEDSFTPSDFDLTPYLRDGSNRLCVEVYKHSSASWLEDQDFFRFSGIFREVFLYAKPAVHAEDLWFKTELNPDLHSGSLQLRAKLSGAAEGASLHLSLTHPYRGTLYDSELSMNSKGDALLSETLEFSDLLPWSHEAPELYRAVLTLRDADGTVVEIIPYSVGFRRLELRGGVMYFNGSRLMINGINRHEWNPATGRAITPEDMHRAMDTICKNNLNAVRTCHYPDQTLWYHLCDERGIYVMDETNLESHGSWQKLGKVEPSWNVPGNKPEWKAAVVDRAKSMFERDKNHASILFWSCGNESYAGEDILDMADFFRAQDPSRLVHYEGVFHNRQYDRISDMESRMYATPAAIREYLESNPEKPFILCEYMHDMGNSLGGMESYIRLGEEFEQYQGGFIWDYMDQALWHKNAQGETVLGYGGDFLDRQTDYAFSGNGIVFADGSEKPAMQDVRYWYASSEERAVLDQVCRQARAASSLTPAAATATPLHIVHGDGALGVRGGDFEILFSRSQGGPSSMKVRGQEWLWREPRPAFWRAPTENDMGNGFNRDSAIWAAVEGWQECIGFEVLCEQPDRFSIRYTYTSRAMPDLKTEITYTVADTGAMTIHCRYSGAEGRPQLPLFGLRFATPVPVDETQWLGLSGETYPDRKKGGRFGVHSEMPHVPDYLVPQECGCHTDTEEFHLRIGGNRLCIQRGDKPFCFSALPYTPQQLDQAAHVWELPKSFRTVVSVCSAMRGVGGIDSWMTDVEPAYHVSSAEDQELTFRILL